MGSRTRKIGFFSICLAGLLTVGGAYFLRSNERVYYKTTKVEKGDIESNISATGTCNAVVTVQVGSQVSGNIKELLADFNTEVKKGQIVAKIDPESFQARVNQAKANQDSADASVLNSTAAIKRAEAEAARARADLKNSQANVARQKVTVLDSKSKFESRKKLAAEKVLASEELDTAKATYDSAVATLEAAESSVQASQASEASSMAQIEVAKSQLRQAQAQARQIAASVEQAQLDLEHCDIAAPVDGVVIARRMDVGQTVAASFSAPTLFEIAQDLTKMQVHTNIDEADIGRVQIGQKATFMVDAHPGFPFHGEVSEIRKAPINNQNVVTYDVVISVGNPDLRLFPGMTASVRILTDRHEAVLKVPNSALRYKPPTEQASAPKPTTMPGMMPPMGGFGGPPGGMGGPRGGGGGERGGGGRRGAPGGVRMQTLYRVGPDGLPSPVQVKTLISDGASTEIDTTELHEGDEIVIGNVTGKPVPSIAPAPQPGGTGGGGRRGAGF